MDRIIIVIPAGYYEDTIDLRGIKGNISLIGLSAKYSLADVIKAATIGTFNDYVLNDYGGVKVAN